VLVLLDLGSAIMSTEMAVEFLDPEVAGRVAVSSAPLVEGLVAAVVTAGTGASLEDVRTEAERGLAAKQDHLGAGAVPAADGGAADSADATARDDAPRSEDGLPANVQDSVLSAELRVDIPHGLHARPAARLVACVKNFSDAHVRLRNLDGAERFVDAGSLSAVATLNVRTGDRVEVHAAGDRAADVLQALTDLAATGFGDNPDPAEGENTSAQPHDPGPESSREADAAVAPVQAGSAGSGLDAAMGALTRPAAHINIQDYMASGERATEQDVLSRALRQARTQLASLVEATRADARMDTVASDIFEAHQALLDDSALLQPAQSAIDEGRSAAQAWRHAGEAVASQFEALDDEYQRERAQDVRSVTDRVLRTLIDLSRGVEAARQGDSLSVLSPDDGGEQDDQEPVIVVVSELDPGTAATLDAARLAGVLCTAGGATGHGVIIATARGLPVMTGVREVSRVADGVVVAFDLRRRQVLIDPTSAQRSDFEEMLQRRRAEQADDQARAREPGQTSDGHRVKVMANVTGTEEARRAVEMGAEGSGLVRTEVMFEAWTAMPTIEEQVRAFTSVAQAFDPAPITIRTWDIGADKPLPFWSQQPEQNPYLGVRGVRSFRQTPGPLGDQLSAVCQVAAAHPVSVMFPMVSTVEEVQWVLGQLDSVYAQRPGGRPAGLRVGIMIEVPAAAIRAAAMTQGLDFVSIGTNDLTQYVMAAERGNPGVDELFDTLDPAVLALIDSVCRNATDDVHVGVCGAAASDPATAALLVGLGVDDLSASPVAVPRVKSMLRKHTHKALRDVAAAALRLDQADQVRDLLATELAID
ncbi:MAG: phosphoenolpyruvate--protein phosphotransferase, partial [Ornithinimicrobium sp.]